jgi:hypothetical protein
VTHASPPASPVPPDDDEADLPAREAGNPIAVVRGVALAGIGLALAATLAAVVWAELPGQDDAGPAFLAQLPRPEAPQPPPSPLPIPLPEAAPSSSAPDDEAAALRAEVQRLLRIADDLDAQFDRLAEERRQRDLEGPADDPTLPEAVALAATGLPGMPAPLPPLAPGEAARLQPPPVVAVMPPPLDLAADVPGEAALPVAPPRSLAALAVPPPGMTAGPAVMAIATARPGAGRVAAPARRSPEPRSVAISAAQRRCQLVTLRFQLGEEPTHADRLLLREGCL